MKSICLDFETRSRIDLRKVGASVYARDPSTEVLCLGYKIPGQKTQVWEHNQSEPPYELYTAIECTDWELHAHNAAFEILIWRHVMQRLHDAPEIPLTRWRCTAAQAAALALPRNLDGVGQALKLPIRKDLSGHRVMMQLCKPRKPSKNNPDEWYTLDKFPGKYVQLYNYCAQDVDTETLLAKKLPRQTTKEWQVWLLDQKINERGIPIDREAILNAMAVEEQNKEQLCAELAEITDGTVTTGRQVQRMLHWLQDRGVNIEDLRAATVANELKKKHSPEVHRLFEIRQALSKSSVAKLESMLRRADADDRVRGAHLYYGASRTGRWSGAGIQIQNFPRNVPKQEEIAAAIDIYKYRDPDLMEMILGPVGQVLSKMLRPMIAAPPGRKFIICDFAGIEARVLAWMAGEKQLVEAFRDGADIYKQLASKIYAKPVEKITKDERQLGKIAILGCGYGMGGVKFHATCANWGVDLDPEFAGQVVETYRETYKKIRKYWYALSDAGNAATKERRTTRAPKTQFQVRQPWLFLRLPSGRELAYFDPKLITEETDWGPRKQLSYMGIDTYTKQWKRLRTYGGKLAENVVQAVSRDLLVDAMFRLERKGYPIIATVHDEVIIEVDEDYGSAKEVEQIMSVVPSWAKGCPVAAEGFEAKRYMK